MQPKRIHEVLFANNSNVSVCSSDWTAETLQKPRSCLNESDLRYLNSVAKLPSTASIMQLMAVTDCKNERCVVQRLGVTHLYDRFKAFNTLVSPLDINGFANGTYVLNTLLEYEKSYPQFHSYGIQASDINTQDLAKLDLTADIARGIKHWAVALLSAPNMAVANVDKSPSHWTCVFIEHDKDSNTTTIEYFCSWGRSYHWANTWMTNLSTRINTKNGIVTRMKSFPYNMQKNHYYCGYYCTLYVLLRLNNYTFEELQSPILWNEELMRMNVEKIASFAPA